MRKKFFFVYIALLSGLFVACNSSSTDTGEPKVGKADSTQSGEQADIPTTTQEVNLFSGQGHGKLLATVKAGTELEIIEKGVEDVIKGQLDFWYKVKVDGQEGWLFGAYTSQSAEETMEMNFNYQAPRAIRFITDVDAWPGDEMSNDIFAPIGWSADDKFAYILIRIWSNSAMGTIFEGKFYIQDMVSDKIVARYETDEVPHELVPIHVWEEATSKITSMLKQHKISQVTDFSLETVPYTYNDQEYHFALHTFFEQREFSYFEQAAKKQERIVKKAPLVVTAPGMGRATLFNYNVDKDKELPPATKMAVTGCLKSPYTSRLAVLLVSADLNPVDGGANGKRLRVVGCDLAKGYK